MGGGVRPVQAGSMEFRPIDFQKDALVKQITDFGIF